MDLVKKCIFRKRNVFLTGPGGTGKSYLINELRTWCKLQTLNIIVSATTGIAGVNIQGATIHSVSGIGIGDKSADHYIKTIPVYKKGCYERILDMDILVIDEISMMNDILFEKLDKMFKAFRRSKQPFGGVILICSGDFLQLPPVEGKHVFECLAWKEMNFVNVVLEEPKRFDDLEFFNLLKRARLGAITDEDHLLLLERTKEYKKLKASYEVESEQKGQIKPTQLFSKKLDTDSENRKRLQKIAEPEFCYDASDLAIYKDQFYLPTSSDWQDYYNSILDSLAPKQLQFKKGAQVMLTFNLDVAEQLCNGSRGVITDLTDSQITVMFRKKTVVLGKDHKFEYELDKYTTLIRKQFPLKLAFALTIHKSQGCTLDYAVIDLGPSVFATGQAYVALSRCKNLDSVFIHSYVRSCFKADPKCIQYYEELKSNIEEN